MLHASQKEFRRIAVPSDGDCFFHAMHECLKNSCVGQTRRALLEIRRRVASWLNANATSASRQNAARRAGQGGSWAESEEVTAAAYEFGVKIKVWESANRMWIDLEMILLLRRCTCRI